MAKSDVWFEIPPMRDDYQLAEVDESYMSSAVKLKQFLHINESECILCEGCVDICPWKCIHYLSLDAAFRKPSMCPIPEGEGRRSRNQGFFVVDEDECTRCALCIDRCPTNVISLGKFSGSPRRTGGAVRRRAVGVRHGRPGLQERLSVRGSLVTRYVPGRPVFAAATRGTGGRTVTAGGPG